MILSQPDPPAVDKTATRQMLKKSPLFDVDVLEKNLTDDMYKPEKSA